MGIEELRDELKQVSEACNSGSHVRVNKAIGISDNYGYQIRAGKNATLDNNENKVLIQKMINEYRKIFNKQLEKLQSLAK